MLDRVEHFFSKFDPRLIEGLSEWGTTLTDSLSSSVTELSAQAISIISAIATS